MDIAPFLTEELVPRGLACRAPQTRVQSSRLVSESGDVRRVGRLAALSLYLLEISISVLRRVIVFNVNIPLVWSTRVLVDVSELLVETYLGMVNSALRAHLPEVTGLRAGTGSTRNMITVFILRKRLPRRCLCYTPVCSDKRASHLRGTGHF